MEFKEFDYRFYKAILKELDKMVFDATYNPQSFKKDLIMAVVALKEDIPIGFYVLKNSNNLKACNISLLVVDPKYKGQGIGNRLLNHSIENAKKLNFKYADLGVHKENEVALHLYVKNDFIIRKNMKDRYIMRKTL